MYKKIRKAMSIYFQFPAIDEYPVMMFPKEEEEEDKSQLKIDPKTDFKEELNTEIKDYLTLKPI